jgi:hypothetical protein
MLIDNELPCLAERGQLQNDFRYSQNSPQQVENSKSETVSPTFRRTFYAMSYNGREALGLGMKTRDGGIMNGGLKEGSKEDLRRFGTSQIAMESANDIQQRKQPVASMMDSGVTRDEDGIDRVPDPPATLLPYLQQFKIIARGEGIDLNTAMMDAGGTRYGTIPTQKFCAKLTDIYKRFVFSEQLLFSLACAYGTGCEDIRQGGFELVAWKDFVEDVMKQGKRLPTSRLPFEHRRPCSHPEGHRPRCVAFTLTACSHALP